MKRLMIAAAIALAAQPAMADDLAKRRSNEGRRADLPTEPFTGKALPIDGDTLIVSTADHGDVRVRIWGIDSPEMKNWPWGPWSRGVLDEWLSAVGDELNCTPKGKSYQRVVAQCLTVKASEDVGRVMIEVGAAIEYRTFSKGVYRDAEAIARKAKRGVWNDR